MAAQRIDRAGLRWRTSSVSADVGNCVELAVSGRFLLVRDSKNPFAGSLLLPVSGWPGLRDQISRAGPGGG